MSDYTSKPKSDVQLSITKKFRTSVDRTQRVMQIAEAFGIGLDDREFTVFDGLEVTIKQGDVIYVTGQSGSGKSTVLREISAGLTAADKKVAILSPSSFYDETRPIIDMVGKDMADATRILALAGISDAYLYLRRPRELSDGQRYRLNLAILLEADADVWVADEFGAVLDRVTAQVVAFNAQKLARKVGKTLIVATTHTDLAEALAPSLTISKRFHDRVEVTRSNP